MESCIRDTNVVIGAERFARNNRDMRFGQQPFENCIAEEMPAPNATEIFG